MRRGGGSKGEAMQSPGELCFLVDTQMPKNRYTRNV
jgi:hypothetical protein